jgi:hypothetical protein
MQFRLSALFLLFVVLWSSLAAFGGIGGVVCCMILVGLAITIARGRSWKAYLAFWSCFALLILCLLPAVASVPEAARRITCANQLKQLVVALDAYHQTNGRFPPAYIADKNGKPMHSWRVLILPFLQLDNLYKEYDFNEPWNGPNNRRLLALRPKVYVCPGSNNLQALDTACTSYVAVVGAHAAWQPDSTARLGSPSLQKNAADPALLIEDNSGIRWTEPRDFSLDALEKTDSQSSASAIRGPHLRGNGYF